LLDPPIDSVPRGTFQLWQTPSSSRASRLGRSVASHHTIMVFIIIIIIINQRQSI
jgi:hypothetical protein